ncbi:MAG: hypothetical protein F6K65_13090 [Moorea sp. SIO3C2]|nr:hypothetical protein [Moorena sp. SIO3C2]
MGETTAIASGGNPQDRAASPRPRCLPKTALPPQDRAASPRPRCLPKTALPPQDRTGSRSWGGPPRPRYLAASLSTPGFGVGAIHF